MNAIPKTIQIFLPGGDPQGIRVAELTTRIVQVIEVPRSQLQEFLKMPESNQVALYFLIGESEDAEERRVYVGQTGDLRARLTSHNKEKDFWERVLVLISRTIWDSGWRMSEEVPVKTSGAGTNCAEVTRPARWSSIAQFLAVDFSTTSHAVFEKAHLPATAWPPTSWYESWVSGLDVFDVPREASPIELRWLVYRKTGSGAS